MIVKFYRAALREESGSRVQVWCAQTPFGIRACREDREDIVLDMSMDDLSSVQLIATVDLTGLDREALETIVDLIMKGGFLGKPGVKDKGDAVLFMLTNEALHVLAEIARQEDEREIESPVDDSSTNR